MYLTAMLLWGVMARPEVYTHFLLTHPRPFLLMSYFYLVAKALKKKSFYFKTDEFQTVGHKPVLNPQQVRSAIKFLEKRGFISIEKHQDRHLRNHIFVTILNEDFLYV